MSDPGLATITVLQSPAGGVGGPEVKSLAAALPPSDLVVIPELANTPYFPLGGVGTGSIPHGTDLLLAEQLKPYQDLARGLRAYVVAGLCVGGPHGLRNCAVVVGRDGNLVPGRGLRSGSRHDVYDKTHLCNVRDYGARFLEDDYFVAGDELVTWDLDFARIGVLICYDRHFPGAWSALRSAGAELVAVPTASPAGTSDTFLAEMQTMALQHSVFVAVANRHGRESLDNSDVDYLGQSAVIGPAGRVQAVAPPGAPCHASGTFSRAELTATVGAMGLLGARRPDLYADTAAS